LLIDRDGDDAAIAGDAPERRRGIVGAVIQRGDQASERSLTTTPKTKHTFSVRQRDCSDSYKQFSAATRWFS
jgi:hypothetical protein